MRKLGTLVAYLASGFLLAWLLVNADHWDSVMSTYHVKLVQVWAWFIILTISCLAPHRQRLTACPLPLRLSAQRFSQV